MQFYTLNQILNDLTTICNNHAQIKQFRFGEYSDISASEQQHYPLVWADVVPASIAEKTLLLNLVVRVMDIQKADAWNEQDTLSDTLSIAQDIYAALTNPIYEDYFYIQRNVTLNPMREALDDVVNGWEMNLVFELAQLRDRCQIPAN
jgi:hypothetical protein